LFSTAYYDSFCQLVSSWTSLNKTLPFCGHPVRFFLAADRLNGFLGTIAAGKETWALVDRPAHRDTIKGVFPHEIYSFESAPSAHPSNDQRQLTQTFRRIHVHCWRNRPCGKNSPFFPNTTLYSERRR
jgi:hypothetical protein